MSLSLVRHPFTQHGLGAPMMHAVATDGTRLFDAISSWWVFTYGHRHPDIMAAICDATEACEQIIFTEFTHEAAEAIAGVLDCTAKELQHVFYCDSESTAVEAAFGTFCKRSVAGDRIVVMQHGRHGDTIVLKETAS